MNTALMKWSECPQRWTLGHIVFAAWFAARVPEMVAQAWALEDRFLRSLPRCSPPGTSYTFDLPRR